MNKMKLNLFKHKVFLPLLIIVLLLGSQFLLPNIAHAELEEAEEGEVCEIGKIFDIDCFTSLGAFVKGLTSITLNVVGVIISPVAALLLSIMSVFTLTAGVLLNQVVHFTILDMSNTLPKAAIVQIWSIVRDVANMSFIFILLYTSILLIIGQKSTTDARNLIVKMVIAALLINFSLFGTRVIIDASNLIAITLYGAVAPGALEAGASFKQFGISNSITRVLNLQSIFDLAGTLNGTKVIIMGIMGSILLLVSAFIFLAISIMLIIRFVVLIFVMIFSPIALMADIIPGAKGHFTKWKDALINHAFFPAIYFFVTWIALTILQTLTVPGASTGKLSDIAGTLDTTGKASYDEGAIGLLLNFIIVIVFMVASLTISKSMAQKVPYGANKAIDWATGKAGAGTFGLAGRFGRGTVGRAAQARADNPELQERAARGDIGARLQLATARKAATASFDGRASIGKQMGAGAAQKGGFAGDIKRKEEELQKNIKSLRVVTPKEEEEKAKAMNVTAKAAEEAKDLHETEIKRVNTLVDTAITKSPELLAAEAEEERVKDLAETEAKSAELADAEAKEENARSIAVAEAEAVGYVSPDGSPATDEQLAGENIVYQSAKAEADRLRGERLKNIESKQGEAKAEAERLRGEYEKSRTDFIETELAPSLKTKVDTEKAAKEAKEMDAGKDRVERVLEKRKDKIETKDGKKREWRPNTDRIFGLGLIKRESEERVRILRKSLKEKTEEEKLLEQLKKVNAKEAKDEEDRIEKEKKDKEGETSSTDSASPTP
ncbi:MAG: hypothetical protein M3Q24_01090 [bacterium]|nr:hypothetical protein [bacterium]